MASIINVNENGVIYVENDEGLIFGIVSASKITDEDGIAFQEDSITVLENNGFEMSQDWDREETYVEFTEAGGESSRVVFNNDNVKYLTHDDLENEA